jgi:hypothetical protein
MSSQSSPLHAKSGNIRTMTVTEWMEFLKAGATRQRTTPDLIARQVKEQIDSSKHLDSEEKDRIFRTIDRALEAEAFGSDLNFHDDPDDPRITLAPPKVEGRYDSTGPFIDRLLTLRIMALPKMLPSAAFATGLAFAAVFFAGLSNTAFLQPFAVSLWAYLILEAFESKAQYPPLRFTAMRRLTLTALFSAPFLAKIFTSSFEAFFESFWMPSTPIGWTALGVFLLSSMVCLTVSDFLLIQADMNVHEKRYGVAAKLALASPVLVLVPGAVIFMVLR